MFTLKLLLSAFFLAVIALSIWAIYDTLKTSKANTLKRRAFIPIIDDEQPSPKAQAKTNRHLAPTE